MLVHGGESSSTRQHCRLAALIAFFQMLLRFASIALTTPPASIDKAVSVHRGSNFFHSHCIGDRIAVVKCWLELPSDRATYIQPRHTSWCRRSGRIRCWQPYHQLNTARVAAPSPSATGSHCRAARISLYTRIVALSSDWHVPPRQLAAPFSYRADASIVAQKRRSARLSWVSIGVSGMLR